MAQPGLNLSRGLFLSPFASRSPLGRHPDPTTTPFHSSRKVDIRLLPVLGALYSVALIGAFSGLPRHPFRFAVWAGGLGGGGKTFDVGLVR